MKSVTRAIKSDDARKLAIVAALKRKSGCTKVTMVKSYIMDGKGYFEGFCLRAIKLGRVTRYEVVHPDGKTSEAGAAGCASRDKNEKWVVTEEEAGVKADR